MNPIVSFFTSLVAPVAKVFEKREDRKAAVQSIQAKTAQAKQGGDTQISLSDKEWELIGQQMQGGTWKDEFVTLVVFAPFITALLGAVLAVFDKPELAQASVGMMTSIAGMNIDYGQLLYITALAALGLKALKK